LALYHRYFHPSLIHLITISDRIVVYDFRGQIEYVTPDPSEVSIPHLLPAELGQIRDRLSEKLDAVLRDRSQARSHCFGAGLAVAERLLSQSGGVIVAGFQGLTTLGEPSLEPRTILSATPETDLLHYSRCSGGRSIRTCATRLNRNECCVHIVAYAAEEFIDLLMMAVATGVPRLYRAGNLNDLYSDLYCLLRQTFSYRSTIELRVSAPAKVQSIYVNFMVLSPSDIVSFPVLSPSDAFAASLSVEGRIKRTEVVIQSHFFWSDLAGRRFVRVFSFALPVSASVSAVQRSADEVAVHALLTKMAVGDVFDSGGALAVLKFRSTVKRMLKCGLSESWVMQFTHALAMGPLLFPIPPDGIDGRVCTALWARGANPIDLLLWTYPRLFALDTNQGPLPLNTNSLSGRSVFLFHTVTKVVIYIHASANSDYLQRAFGVQRAKEIRGDLPTLESPENEAIHDRWRECCQISGGYLPCEITHEGVERFLVESQHAPFKMSLTTWICDIRAM
jgi:hypothetical protein